MKKSKRILAIVLSLLMVASTIDFSTFAADGEEDQIAVQVENDSSEQTEDDSAPAAKPVEEQRTEEVVTEEEPQKGAPQEPQQESEKSEKEQVSVAENTSEQPAETSFDATVTVAYDDVENIAGRRPKNEVFTKGTFLEIYADGQKMNTQPSIEYVPEADGKEHGTSHGMEADTYRIKNLSAYHEDGTTKIQYSVKIQPEQMIGYIGGDDQDVTWKKFDYAGPSDEVKLIQNKDGSTSGEKTFACYLPVYKAEGTITWNPSENAKDIPSIEEYFNQFFKVLRDGEAYTAVRVHYEQDEKNENIWHYSVAGLFSVREDGTKASYVFTFDEPEGWNSQNTQIIVDNNVENENVNFTVKEPAKKMFMQAAQPRIEEGPSVDGNGGSASFQAKWVTNTLPESFYEAKIPSELYFRVKSTDGTLGTYVKFAEVSVDGTLTLTEEAKTQLGITEEQVAGIKVNGAVTGTGIQTYTVNGLPNILNQTRLDEEGNEITEKAGTVEYGFWSAYGNGALIGQIDADGQEGTDYTIRRVDSGVELIETIDFTAMIDIHSGGVYKVSSSDVINAFKLESGEYTYTFEDGGKICYGKTPLYGVEWTISEDGTLTISNLPGYTLDKTLIDWKVSVDTEKFDNEKNLPEGDYFECEYNNSKVPNHGSDREICHNGGSLTLTIKGDTEYTGTKVWLDEYTDSSDDEKKAHRPEAEWELWRYSEKPGVDWSQSSPVRDDEGEQVQWTIDQIKNENDYTTERYLNLANLPKYDTDGYKYVYFIRESMSGGDGYEQVFGTVEENGTVNDTYPDNVKRPDKDKSLYNGGTLSNRHVGSVNVSQSKTWKAEAHQDELKDVFVRLVLQKSVDGGKTWEDTDTVQDLTNFTAEQLTKTASASMPKYDEFGNPYTYRWVEQGVYEGKPDESENVLKENGDFSLTHNTLTYADGKKYDPNVEEEHYESITEDGMIVNKLVGTTSYIIKKTWEGGAPEDASVEWILYQNDKEIQTGTMTATDNWDVFIDELPKYDENGVEYEYKATEKVPDGWRLKDIIYNQTLTESRNGYTRENNTCELVNTKDEIGDGLGDRILIRKDWIDDGDKACREEVQVRVVRNAYDRDGIQADEKEITKEPVKLNEVNLWEQYLDGEKYIIDNGDGQKILGTREDWQKSHENGAEPGEEDIASDVTYSIWEVGLKSASGNGVYYEPYSDMQSALLDVTAKNKSDNPDENRYIGNENHIYYIEYPENGTVGKEDPVTKDTYFSVTNRRVGVINIDVTKTWLDGRNLLPGGISDAERIAFEAMIQLKCEEYPNAVGESIVNLHGDSEIKGTVQEIQDNNGETANSKQSIGVNLDENGKEYIYFHNLPKYDKDGKVVHYNVEETSKDDELKNHDYQMNVAEEYTTGAQHTNDKEAFAIENKRSAVKEVTFYKEWKDQYRFDKKQRPDIYLTLYRKSASPDADAVVTEYDNIWWDQADISDKENDSNVIIEKKIISGNVLLPVFRNTMRMVRKYIILQQRICM